MAENLHLADLWVAVVPDTSKVQPAVEEAGKKAKGSFTQSIRGISDSLHKELTDGGNRGVQSLSGVSGKIKDIFHRTGTDSGKALADGFSHGAKDIEKANSPLRGIAANAVKASSGVTSLSGAFSKLSGAGESLTRLNSQVDSIGSTAKQVGLNLDSWKVPAPVIDGVDHVSNISKDLRGHFDDARASVKRFGESGGGLTGLIGKLGEVGAVVATVKEGLDGLQRANNSLRDKFEWYKNFDNEFKNNPLNRFLNNLTGSSPDNGASGPLDAAGNPLFKSGTVSPITPPPAPTQYPSNMVGPIPPGATRTGAPIAPRPDTTHSFYKDWYSDPEPSTPEPSPSRSSGGGGSRAGGSGGSLSSRIGTPSNRAGVAAAGSRIANLYAFAHSLVGTPYSQALRNDCSGMVAKLANVALGLPPEASFSTVNEGQWLFSHGFEPGLGGPNDLNIGWYDHGGGNFGHTAATLPGGVHAESGGSHGSFLLGPGAAGAEDSQFTQHAHLSMGKFRASSLADSSSDSVGKQIPTGEEHDPLYVTSTGPGGSSQSPFESQGQQLGQGLVNGFLQMFGLDGSVFGGKSPLDWGAVKLGGGLLNWGMKTAQSMSGAGGMAAGGDGAMLPGLLGMIPSPGAMISAGAGAAGGSLGIGAATGGDVNIHHDQSFNPTVNVTGNANPNGIITPLQHMDNSYYGRKQTYSGSLPVPPG